LVSASAIVSTQLLVLKLFFRGISTTGFAEKEDFVRALVESAKL